VVFVNPACAFSRLWDRLAALGSAAAKVGFLFINVPISLDPTGVLLAK
jgi:hypothetical protein